jgi:transcription termination/antitermination protein NusG
MTNQPMSILNASSVVDGRERQWLAAYTSPRHEKQLSLQLEQRSIESFLPLYNAVRRWKTGPARVSLPLFPGYIFVNVNHRERRTVLELPSIVRIVGSRSGPSVLLDSEMERLRQAVASGLAEPHPYLSIGTRVRIVRGPLTGTEGLLLRKKGRTKVVVSVDVILQAVAVEVDACDLERCSESKPKMCAA